MPTNHLLSLPWELRSHIFELTCCGRDEVIACGCVDDVKLQPFAGNCTTKHDLQQYVHHLPGPIYAAKQTYHETVAIADLCQKSPTPLVLGGTRRLQIFLKHLPVQHPSTILLRLRLHVSMNWLHTTWGPGVSTRYMDSMIGSLGIGTGQRYTAKTTSTILLPKRNGSELQVMEVEATLTMLD